jgi:hypothetical protein
MEAIALCIGLRCLAVDGDNLADIKWPRARLFLSKRNGIYFCRLVVGRGNGRSTGRKVYVCEFDDPVAARSYARNLGLHRLEIFNVTGEIIVGWPLPV